MTKDKKTFIEAGDAHYVELIRKLDGLVSGQEDIKRQLAARAHLDEETIKHREIIVGNGKIGLIAIRDKFLSWETKINALFVGLVLDIVLRVIQFAYN